MFTLNSDSSIFRAGLSNKDCLISCSFILRSGFCKKCLHLLFTSDWAGYRISFSCTLQKSRFLVWVTDGPMTKRWQDVSEQNIAMTSLLFLLRSECHRYFICRKLTRTSKPSGVLCLCLCLFLCLGQVMFTHHKTLWSLCSFEIKIVTEWILDSHNCILKQFKPLKRDALGNTWLLLLSHLGRKFGVVLVGQWAKECTQKWKKNVFDNQIFPRGDLWED